MEVLVVVHETREIQFGGQDKLGVVLDKQVVIMVEDQIPIGQEPSLVEAGEPSEKLILIGPKEQLGIRQVEGNKVGINKNFVEKGIGPSDVLRNGPTSKDFKKAKISVWKRAAREKALESNSDDLNPILGSRKKRAGKECGDLVKEGWGLNDIRCRSMNGMSDVNGRIYMCAANLSKWNANRKELYRNIDLKKKELAEASNVLVSGSWRAIRRIKGQLDNLLAQEEKFWQ
ncbi:hypothetical protein QYF36_008585 [Acer negundo]|nr:hypothetical protein QYF36_008585 [Acer negundo]